MKNMATMPDEQRVEPLLPKGSQVGIIAGSGSLPANLAESLEQSGFSPYIIIIDGEADRLADLTRYKHQFFTLEEAAPAIEHLRKSGMTHVILAGGVNRRPKARNLKWTPRILKALPKIAFGLLLGDDGLLRAVVRVFEAHGMKIIGAHEIVSNLLAKEGAITQRKPSAQDMKDIEAGIAGALAIGRLDIGQAAVAVGGRVIALEGIEGTEELIKRCIPLRLNGRIAGRTGGALVKFSKPGQELRTDLPAMGLDTIDQVKRAGLNGIALEAGRTFILDMKQTIEAADKAGLFIYGVTGNHHE